MKKKFLSIIMCVLIALSILPITAYADETISSINVYNTYDPYIGQTVKENLDLISLGSGSNYVIENKYWIAFNDDGTQRIMSESETFQKSNTITGQGYYKLVVDVKAKSGFDFEHDGDKYAGTFSSTYLPFDKFATLGYDNKTVCITSFNRYAVFREAVKSVSITGVVKPIVGQTASQNLAGVTAECDKCLAPNVYWFDVATQTKLSPSDTFAIGKPYQLKAEFSIGALASFPRKLTGQYLGSVTFTGIGAAQSNVTFQYSPIMKETLTVTSNVTLADLYATISVTNGKATVGGNEVTIASAGTVVTITADAPTTSYTFKQWTVKSGGAQLVDATSTQTSFVMPNSSVEIVAEYNHTHVLGNWTSNDNGTHSRTCQYCSYSETTNCTMTSNVVNPTCTEQGYTEHTCSVCSYSFKDTYTNPIGHNLSAWTSNNDGTHSKTCSRCTYTENEDCDYNDVVTNPTCTEQGYTTHTCKECSYSFKDTYTNPLGHNLSAWTSNNDGTHTRNCSRCTYTENEDCDYNDVVTNPTCTENGYTTHTCTACDYSFIDTYVEPTGHKNTKVIGAKESTCIEEGYTGDVFCEDCKTVIEKGKAIEKKAHDYVDGKCTVCGAVDPNYTPAKKDDSKTSPDTGFEASAWASLLVIGLGVVAVTLTRKKREE